MSVLHLSLHLGVVKAPSGAVASLAAMLVAVALFTLGWRLAVRHRFVAHRWVQTVGVALTTAVALAWMVRSLARNVLPQLPGKLGQAPYASAVVHAVVAVAAVILGVYVVLAASALLPRSLRFTAYKPVMRTSYAIYLAATLTGVILYVVAYVGL